jgi:putative GTP pyrophosphokinase
MGRDHAARATRARSDSMRLMEIDELRAKYHSNAALYKRLEAESRYTLEAVIAKEQIRIHSFSSRVKEFASFAEKAKRKDLKDPLAEITDVVGLRVVCLFRSDIPRIGAGVQHVLLRDFGGQQNRRLRRCFFWLSVRSLYSRDEARLLGPRYEGLSGMRFEVQVRTISMDTWATISHYLDYKTDRDVPKDLRKDFFALSGLFYVADTHFELFYRASERSRDTVAASIDSPATGLARSGDQSG